MAVGLCHILTAPCVCLLSVIVTFPDHTDIIDQFVYNIHILFQK